MRIKTKGIIKKIALVLAGVVALSAVGFGVAKLVEFVKDDLKTISPVFDVGNLGTDGKFVDDESTLYTKEAFACDGLQIKLDFDNQIEYQIYFYDDLDNFVESTEVLSAAYSETVHDGYARIVIMPTNDEDEKISLTERVTYPGQMTIKVAKEQNVEYVNVFNKRLQIVDNTSHLRFLRGGIEPSGDSYLFNASETSVVCSKDLLEVDGGSTVSFTYKMSDDVDTVLHLFEFTYIKGELNLINTDSNKSTYTLDERTTHIVLSYSLYNSSEHVNESISDELISSSNNYLVVTK